MIEEALMQYGVLGLWTISLLVERYAYNKKTQQIIINNTKALTLVHETINKCNRGINKNA